MYFSSSLSYSSKYVKDSPDGKLLIICMVTPGKVYPGLLSFHFSLYYYYYFYFSYFLCCFFFFLLCIYHLKYLKQK